MNSERVKEIKKGLECCSTLMDNNATSEEQDNACQECPYRVNDRCSWKLDSDALDLINELESENDRLSKEKEDLRLFDIALGNGKVDMTLGGNTAKSFINAIVQIFEQNNATNFLATTIETISSGNKYSLVIQKENGQTPSEKLTELKDRIALLEKDNKTLPNAKVVYENVDYCYEDLKKAEKRIAELEHKCDDCAGCTQWKCDCANIEAEALKQFAERLKEKEHIKKIVNEGWIVSYVEICNDIDETLKECLCDKYQ